MSNANASSALSLREQVDVMLTLVERHTNPALYDLILKAALATADSLNNFLLSYPFPTPPTLNGLEVVGKAIGLPSGTMQALANQQTPASPSTWAIAPSEAQAFWWDKASLPNALTDGATNLGRLDGPVTVSAVLDGNQVSLIVNPTATFNPADPYAPAPSGEWPFLPELLSAAQEAVIEKFITEFYTRYHAYMGDLVL